MLNAATAWMSIVAYILTYKLFDGVLFVIKDPLWFPVIEEMLTFGFGERYY